MSKRHVPGKWDLLRTVRKGPIPIPEDERDRAAADALVADKMIIRGEDNKLYPLYIDPRWTEPRR